MFRKEIVNNIYSITGTSVSMDPWTCLFYNIDTLVTQHKRTLIPHFLNAAFPEILVFTRDSNNDRMDHKR